MGPLPPPNLERPQPLTLTPTRMPTPPGANLAEIRANLQRARVVAEVPAPICGLVRQKLLVMTFSEGAPPTVTDGSRGTLTFFECMNS